MYIVYTIDQHIIYLENRSWVGLESTTANGKTCFRLVS